MTTNLFPRVGSLMDNKLVLFIFLLFSVPHRTNSDSALHTSAMNQNPQDPFGLNQQMGRGPPQRNGESNTHTHHKLLQGRRFCWFPLLPLTRPRCRPVPFTRVLVEGNTTPLRRSLPVFHWIDHLNKWGKPRKVGFIGCPHRKCESAFLTGTVSSGLISALYTNIYCIYFKVLCLCNIWCRGEY